jgi:hypothetical protein
VALGRLRSEGRNVRTAPVYELMALLLELGLVDLALGEAFIKNVEGGAAAAAAGGARLSKYSRAFSPYPANTRCIHNQSAQFHIYYQKKCNVVI